MHRTSLALLHSVIVLENYRHLLNQSDAKLTVDVAWSQT